MLKLDILVLQFIRHIVGVSKVTDWLVVFFADYLIYILIAAFIYFLFKLPRASYNIKSKIRFFALATLSVILSRGILTELIRFFFFRLRPFVAFSFSPLISVAATEGSFPSGHMALIIPIALAMFTIDRKKGFWFMVLALLIGIARIAVGVHYPSDILGGIFVGLLSFFAVKWSLSRK